MTFSSQFAMKLPLVDCYSCVLYYFLLKNTFQCTYSSSPSSGRCIHVPGKIRDAFGSRRDSCVSRGTTKASYFFYETTWAYLSFKKTLTQSDA